MIMNIVNMLNKNMDKLNLLDGQFDYDYSKKYLADKFIKMINSDEVWFYKKKNKQGGFIKFKKLEWDSAFFNNVSHRIEVVCAPVKNYKEMMNAFLKEKKIDFICCRISSTDQHLLNALIDNSFYVVNSKIFLRKISIPHKAPDIKTSLI